MSNNPKDTNVDLSRLTIEHTGVKMGNHNDGELKKVLEKGLRTQFLNGMKQGTYAVCSVLYDKATDTSKTADERIEDIMQFCSVSMKKKS